MDEWEVFYVGGYVSNTRRWTTVLNEPFDSQSSLWGPGEPSGDGLCGDMLFRENWSPKWRINDEKCSMRIGFVCEKQKTASGKD